jgi:hypothetical protein
VTLWYQTASREYVEFLRDEDRTTSNGPLLYDLWAEHGKSEPVAMARAFVDEKSGFAEACRKNVSRVQKRYLKVHEREWSRCFETEGEGRSCDATSRDTEISEAEAELRTGLGGAKDKHCAGSNLTPSSLGHGTSCPVPCASITLFDVNALADCTVCLAEALDGAALQAAWGAAPPAVPDTTAPSAASCQASFAKASAGLAADATKALAKCEKSNAKGKEPPSDCSQDPALAKARDKARRELERCESLAGVDGCAEAGDVDGALACMEDALSAPAAGYVGASYP